MEIDGRMHFLSGYHKKKAPIGACILSDLIAIHPLRTIGKPACCFLVHTALSRSILLCSALSCFAFFFLLSPASVLLLWKRTRSMCTPQMRGELRPQTVPLRNMAVQHSTACYDIRHKLRSVSWPPCGGHHSGTLLNILCEIGTDLRD